MVKKIAISLALLLLVGAGTVLVIALTKPDQFRVERSLNMQASPEKIYALISDFHKWEQWSPWEKMDPKMERSFSGTGSGVGQVYSWKGNDNVGEGRMEIIKVEPPTNVTIRLEFIKPMAGVSTSEFNLSPSGDATAVTWSMHGSNDYMGKVMMTIFDCDKMTGDQFLIGLNNLKQQSESQTIISP